MTIDNFISRNQVVEPLDVCSEELMNREPALSVLLITYNHEEYVRKSLESILNQSFKDYELIICDDESSDGTWNILSEYHKEYLSVIRLIRNSRKNNVYINGSPSYLFNFFYGISKVRGKYLAFLEGDDFWMCENRIENQLRILENNPDISLVSGGFRVIDSLSLKESVKVAFRSNTKYKIYSLGDPWLSKIATVVCRVDWDVLEILPRYKFFRDINLIYHLLSVGSGLYINRVLAVAHHHEGGIHSKIGVFRQKLNTYYVYKELLTFERTAYTKKMYIDSYYQLSKLNLPEEVRNSLKSDFDASLFGISKTFFKYVLGYINICFK